MANITKQLNTRISLRYANYADYSADMVLLPGEVALAVVETTATTPAGTVIKVPQTLAKVGDGTKKFRELNWLTAPASDVADFLKKNTDGDGAFWTKDTFTAWIKSLVDINDVGAYTKAEIDQMVSTLNGDIAGVKTELIGASTDAANANTIYGTKKYADEAAAAAITAANLDQYVTDTELAAEVKTRGEADAALSGRIDTIDATIAGLTDTTYTFVDGENGTFKVTAKGGNEQTIDTGAKDYVDGIVGDSTKGLIADIADAKKAGTDAADAASQAQGTADTNTGLINGLTGRMDTAEDNIEALQEKVKNATTVMSFEGAVVAKPADGDTSYQSGDVVIVTGEGDDAGKEFVYDGTTWHELGFADANSTAIENLQGRMTTAEGKLDTLESGKAEKDHTHTISATATDDDVIILTGTEGTNGVTYDAKHANSGVAAGSYTKVTVDEKGHVTAGDNPTTLAGYGITDAYTQGAGDALEGRVGTAEGNITTLQGAVSALQEADKAFATTEALEAEITRAKAAEAANAGAAASAQTAAETAQGAADIAQQGVDDINDILNGVLYIYGGNATDCMDTIPSQN